MKNYWESEYNSLIFFISVDLWLIKLSQPKENL